MTQVFELHFNPKNKERETVFDSFCFDPTNFYEKKLGNLYIAGQLFNVLPQNYQFLNNLAQTIKKEYYNKSSQSPEENLRESLKKSNDFLSEVSKEGDVSWLGNLDFAILSIKDFVLAFSKIGNIKILLARGGDFFQTKAPIKDFSESHQETPAPEILDIGRNLEFQEIEPYPLKIFSNIAVGKLAPYDRIIILTREIFESFSKGNLLRELALVSEEKQLNEIFKQQEKALKELYGICLLIILGEPKINKMKTEDVSPPIIFEKEKPSPIQLIFLTFHNLVLILGGFLKKLSEFCFNGLIEPILIKLKKRLGLLVSNRNFLLIFILILLFILGFFLFKGR